MSGYLGSHVRRRFLTRSGAVVAGSLAAPFGGIEVARAQPVSGGIPEVDRLTVAVVTDSYHHAFEPSRRVGDMQVQRFAFALSKTLPSRALQNEWGLSIHAESARGSETRRVLIDFGYTAETLNNNLALLKIDPAAIDALVLSHGHYDHFGGLNGFLAAHRQVLRKGLPFYLGGEECFCTREAGVGDAAGNFGYLDRQAIADAGVQVFFAERPSLLLDHGFTTGRIAADSFEKVLSPTRMSVGFRDGIGCEPARMPQAKRALTKAPDDFEHEQATCYHVKGKGLVVITSCGHRGVVNSVKSAIKASGVTRVHAVMGGFHLAPHKVEYLRETAAALREINPDFLIPMHCTGEGFNAVAQQELGAKYVRSSTGTRYTFGA